MKNQNDKTGSLIVISGPAGVGKGSIINKLIEKCPQIHLSVSETTREPRAKEVHGKDYFFVSKEEFEKGIQSGRYLEYDSHFDHAYGTPADYVQKQMSEGFDIILEIEYRGARQIREKSEDAIFIFILPPNYETLWERLTGRGTENEKQLMLRQARAIEELQSAVEYDYIVVNDDLDMAVDEVCAIIQAEKCKISKMNKKIDEMIGGLNELSEEQ